MTEIHGGQTTAADCNPLTMAMLAEVQAEARRGRHRAVPQADPPDPPRRRHRCAGVTGQCYAPATLRVSWVDLGQRAGRRRAGMCEPCVGLLRQLLTAEDVQTRPTRRVARLAARAARQAARTARAGRRAAQSLAKRAARRRGATA